MIYVILSHRLFDHVHNRRRILKMIKTQRIINAVVSVSRVWRMSGFILNHFLLYHNFQFIFVIICRIIYNNGEKALQNIYHLKRPVAATADSQTKSGAAD